MSRVCQITGKRPMTGNTVSHANNRRRRRFLPNLHVQRFWLESERRFVSLRVSTRGLRTIEKKGIEAVVADLARLWPDLILYAMAGSHLARAARARGLRVAGEAFADRTYQDDGSLTPRSQPRALISDEDKMVEQALSIVQRGVVRTVQGKEVPVVADSLCVHGDTPDAVAFVERLRKELTVAGIALKAFDA